MSLLVAACGTNKDGEFIARELVEEQTLENLYAFGDRLQAVHQQMKKRSGKGRQRKKRTP
jgi:hypothetical protein